MNVKEQLEKIKNLVFNEAQKFESVTTTDGVVIEVSALEVGATATIGEDAAPDGEYVIESGQTLVIEGGVITEIKEATEEEQPAEEQTDDFSAQLKQLKKKFEDDQSEVIEDIEEVSSELDTIKSDIATLKESMAMLIEIVEKLAGEPDAEAVEMSSFKSQFVESKKERLEQLANTIKKFKK